MKPINLNPDHLLGYRIIAGQRRQQVGGKISTKPTAQFGKIGEKSPSALQSDKLGGKLGGKPAG